MSVTSIKCPKCGCVNLKTSSCSSCGTSLENQGHSLGTLKGSSSNESYSNTAKSPPIPSERSASFSANSESSCAHCGKPFPAGEMIEYDGKHVCRTCKPLFLQKLAEGQTPLGDLVYAGFWIRFAAKFIDGITLYVVNSVLSLILVPLLGFSSLAAGKAPDPHAVMANFIKMSPLILLQWGTSLAYVTFFIGKFQATPGKMALRLKVVQPDGGKVSYFRAFGRFFAELLSSMTLLIGYAMAGFDEEKRALHDRLCNTRVVKK
jgi:uncharacterized RDD family membrane protein YckC